jgi:hypothetical protein
VHTLEHALSDTPDITVSCAYIEVTESHEYSSSITYNLESISRKY